MSGSSTPGKDREGWFLGVFSGAGKEVEVPLGLELSKSGQETRSNSCVCSGQKGTVLVKG